ncbi:GIY-YIG nuclease family protein [Burkholderia sp. Ac-20344]|uniref:GIY-YIG nuclease family protein n=1 Tax=Burkholderia sp. Ac-20344 TaxID=2703890 RepID=UPI00197C42DE|nr:GIY-YIG nuclease family protein [Burkholderia sp. Ac-20344]MBN3835930.1 GIY-YIG nuclease family protein [Burkholderia sp. Ac-20344]
MSWFLYLIECADDSVYTGITTDVAARFDEHASGKGARYTRSRKPRAVLASFPLPDRSSASRAEYWVKRLTPVQKRDLAAGLRTLESVLPAGVTIAGLGDATQPPAHGQRKAKKGNTADAPKAVDDTRAGKTTKGVKAAKPAKAKEAVPVAKSVRKPKVEKTASGEQSAKSTQSANKAKAAPDAKRAKVDDATAAKPPSSRRASTQKDKPAIRTRPKRKALAADGKPGQRERSDNPPAPALRRTSTTKVAGSGLATPAPRRGAAGSTRAKAAPKPAAPPASTRTKTTRTKQNRAAS